MKRTLIWSIAISLLLQLGTLASANGTASDLAKTKAAELIAQARTALGGEKKLKALQSLLLSGSYRRVLGEREMSGETEYEILFPDKIKRTETMSPMPNVEITRVEVLNGDQIWSDSQSGGMGGMVMIRRPGADNPQMQASMDNAIRAEFARTLLTLVLTPPSSFPVEYSYVGEAEAPDGKADAIDITGPNKFATRLYLDQKSHRPLMLSYRGRQARMVMQAAGPGGQPRTREDAEKHAKENADKIAAEAQAAPEVEFQIALDDYRTVDGVSFPHSITRMVDGKVTEELTIKKLKVNAPIKAQSFEKK